VEVSTLEWIGYIGVLISVVPLGVGVVFTVLPVLSRFGFLGFMFLPAAIIVEVIKHYEDIEYEFSLIWKAVL
jgi:hypothetical protein